jgi:hypothetical protein
MANVTNGSPEEDLLNYLQKDTDTITWLDDVELKQILERKLSKVFLNGVWIGCTHK